jgi:hypothetical protein
VFVQELRLSFRDKFPHLLASMLAASFGSMFGEEFSALFLTTHAKRFLSRSV